MLTLSSRTRCYRAGILTNLCRRSMAAIQLTPRSPELEISKYSKDPEHMSLILNSCKMEMLEKAKYELGYQVSQKQPELDSNLAKMMEIHMNNVGDPFIETTYRLSCKGIERAIMDYCADLWHKQERNELDPQDPDNYWGYVLNMGSTEGNLNAIWFAREYFTQFTRKKAMTLYSVDTHYSLNKACDMLGVKHDTIASTTHGQIDNDLLLQKVQQYACQGRPIIINFNLGTTFTGAYDHPEEVIHDIERICNEYSVPYWIHLDGALGGFIVPFLDKGIKNGSIKNENALIPRFGFDMNVQSCCASFHKWYGAPFPGGIFMTSNKYLRKNPQTPEYIASPDTTMGGSRNAYTSLYMWWRLSLSDYFNEIEDLSRCLSLSNYLYEELNGLDVQMGAKVVDPSRAPYSLSVTFNSPSPYICNKYSIPHQMGKSHIFTMKHVTKETLDQFVEDFRRQLMADHIQTENTEKEDIEYCIFDGTQQTATIQEAIALTTDAFTTRTEPVAHHLSARDFEIFMKRSWQEAITLETTPMVKINGKLAGICLNDDYVSSEPTDQFMNDLLKRNYFGFSIIFRIISDLDESFKVEMEGEGLFLPGNIMHIWIPAVEGRFSKRGICTDLIQRSVEIAKEKGYKVVIAECTNDYSIKAAQNCGFECYNKIEYKQWEYPKGSGIYPYEAIENVTGFRELCLMVLRL